MANIKHKKFFCFFLLFLTLCFFLAKLGSAYAMTSSDVLGF